jgi:hypothetical protein
MGGCQRFRQFTLCVSASAYDGRKQVFNKDRRFDLVSNPEFRSEMAGPQGLFMGCVRITTEQNTEEDIVDWCKPPDEDDFTATAKALRSGAFL